MMTWLTGDVKEDEKKRSLSSHVISYMEKKKRRGGKGEKPRESEVLIRHSQS